jgi:hypothetical protein
VLFKQLFESHPKIIEEAEAAYTVAMIQEMFYQIDYNDDGMYVRMYVCMVYMDNSDVCICIQMYRYDPFNNCVF